MNSKTKQIHGSCVQACSTRKKQKIKISRLLCMFYLPAILAGETKKNKHSLLFCFVLSLSSNKQNSLIEMTKQVGQTSTREHIKENESLRIRQLIFSFTRARSFHVLARPFYSLTQSALVHHVVFIVTASSSKLAAHTDQPSCTATQCPSVVLAVGRRDNRVRLDAAFPVQLFDSTARVVCRNPSGQPRVLNYETTERLLNEWVEHEPLSTLGDIIEWALATLEAPFISPEAAALAVTAVVATTTPTITTTAAATTTTTTRRSTRTRRAPERFDPTPSTRPHHYEVAGIHGHYQVGRVDYYLVSLVGYDADWLPQSDLACASLVRQFNRNVIAANNKWYKRTVRNHTGSSPAHQEYVNVHGCCEDDNGDQWYLLSTAGFKARWQWVQECHCSCYELIRAFDRQLDRAILSWQPNQHALEMWE